MPTTPSRRRPLRVVGGIVLTLLLLAIVGVALLPTLAGLGPGRRMAASAIGAALDAEVTVDRLSLSWFGSQSIGGVRAVGSDGSPVLDLNASIDRSLVALARGRWHDSTIALDGLAHVRRNADGSFGVPATRPTGGRTGSAPGQPGTRGQPAPPSPGAEPFRLPTPLDLTVGIGRLDLHYTCAEHGTDLRLPDLAATAQLRSAAPISVVIRSSVESDDRQGSLRGDLTIENAVASDGSVALDGARIETEIVVENLRTRFDGDRYELDRVRLAGSTTDITTGLELNLTAKGRADGAVPVELDSDLALRLVMPDGEWMRSELTIGGTVDAALLAAAAAGTAATTSAAPPSGTSPGASPGASPSGGPTSPAEPRGRPRLFPEGLDATVSLDGLSITLADRESGRRVTASDLAGVAVLGTVRPLSTTLSGSTEFEETADGDGAARTTRAGRFELAASAPGLVDSFGMLRLDDTGIDLAATIENVLLPLPDRVVEIGRLEATVASSELTESVRVRLAGDASLDGTTRSTVGVDLVADRPISTHGDITLRPDRVRGEVVAQNLPLAVIEPFLAAALADTPVAVARDIGERADVRIALPGGGDVAEARVETQRLRVNATGRTSVDEALQVDAFDLIWSVPSELLAALGAPVARDLDLGVTAADLRVPFDDDGLRLDGVSGILALTVPGPTSLLDGEGAPILTTGLLSARLATAPLRDGVTVSVDGAVEGGTVTVRQRLTGLVGADGTLTPNAAVATGEVKLEGVPRDRLLELAPSDVRALLAALLTASPSVTVETGGSAERRTASLAAQLGRADLASELALTEDALEIGALTATIVPTDALLAALLTGDDRPRLEGASPIGITVAPVTIPTALLTDPQRLLAEGPPTETRLTAERLTVRQAQSTETAGLHEIGATLRTTPRANAGAGTGIALTADAALRSGTAPAGTLSLTANTILRDGELAPPTGQLEARGLQVAALERLAGAEPGAWSNWLGATGEFVAEATTRDEAIEVSARPNFTQLTGELNATVTDEEIVVPGGTLTLKLPVAQVDRLLGPEPAPPPTAREQSGDRLRQALGVGAAAQAEPERQALRAVGDLDATLRLTDLVVDRGLLAETGPTDPRRTRGTVRIDAQPLVLALGEERIEVRDLQATLATDALSDGVRLNAIAGRPGRAAEGGVRDAVLALTATLRSLTDASGRLDTAGVAIDADLAAETIPTALIDRIGAMNGRLVAALGPTISASLRAQGLSRTAGTLAGKLTSPNGFLEIPRITSRDGVLRVDPSMPIRGELELTRPLRQELLHGINPFLADLRAVEQPIRVTIPSAALPLDGNLRGFDADAAISIGRMELDSGSAIVAILDLTGAQQGRELAGQVDPFNIRIRNGNLTYDDLTLKLGVRDGGYRITLPFTGDIDLAATPPTARAITAPIPIGDVARTVREIPDFVGLVRIDVVFSGPLYAADGQTRAMKPELKIGIDAPRTPDRIIDTLDDFLRRRRR